MIAAGVTASELARSIGIDRSTLRRWTLDGQIPPPDRISPGGRRLYSPTLAEAIRRIAAGLPLDLRWRLAEAIRRAFETAELEPLQERHADRLAVALLEDERVTIL